MFSFHLCFGVCDLDWVVSPLSSSSLLGAQFLVGVHLLKKNLIVWEFLVSFHVFGGEFFCRISGVFDFDWVASSSPTSMLVSSVFVRFSCMRGAHGLRSFGS